MSLASRAFSQCLSVFLFSACSSVTQSHENDSPNTLTSNTQSATSASTANSVSASAMDASSASSTAAATVTSTVSAASASTGVAATTATVTNSTTTSVSATTATSGAGGTAGSTTSSGVGGAGNDSEALGSATMSGSGRTMERYETALVSRNDDPYVFITNGWGPGFDAHTISWEGTSFIVESLTGEAGGGGQPAGYPTVFCGRYSVMQVPDCGLPASRDSINSLRTGWRWAPNGNEGEYNAAYDIWVGTGNQLQGYLMVWLRDPPSFQPAGSKNANHLGVTVANVPGVWDIWDGTVNNLPIINWVRAEGSDSHEIEFDVMDFVRDAEARGFTIPGNQINAVAVGFEIWRGPISGLESVDFYVNVE